jgi:Mrp family chromosome partitioning ATPase/uncharacterized protein involved in exopolysaccharide biosynthesis
MNPKQTSPPPVSGLSLGDIYYILFRRKWVILSVSLLGFIAAGVTYVEWRPNYQSVAQLYIGYDPDAQIPDTASPDLHPMIADRGATILGSELVIVQSFDLARSVAESIGPAKILGNTAGTNAADVDRAAGMIERNLLADVPKTTQIISLSFSHSNPEVVKPVLDLLITNYINKHADIHQRTALFDPYLHAQTDLRKMRLKATADQLAKAKSDGGVVDMAEEMRAFTSQEAAIKQENYMALAELDEALGRAEQLRSMIPPARSQAASTNAEPAASTDAGVPKVLPPSPAEQDAYTKARQRLADLQAKESKLESMYTTSNSQVKANLLDIEAAEAQKKALEEATPGLVLAATVGTESKAVSASGAPTAPSGLDPAAAYNDELTRIAGLSKKIARQTNVLELIRNRGASLVQMQANIHELERNMAIDEQELAQIERTTDEATMKDELGPNRISNISVTEQPTPPAREMKSFNKVIAGIAGGGVALGLGLAFLFEMVLDRSFKRPQEVVSKLGLPFFLSVPYLNGNGKLRLSKQGNEVKLLPAGAAASNGGGADAAPQSLVAPDGGSRGGAVAVSHEGPVAPGAERPALRPFHETLRDRLIAHFEMLNLTHKPKLVALTSCHPGAGVSTMSSGLASSLSETGDGNVLLVNMNSEEGEAHRFYKGKLNLGLDDLFEKEKADRERALVRDNLYVVKESSNRDTLPAILPKRFGHLVSKMKASDYDYIIFDMPPVSQISVTPRLARFMDMVLLVVESEKTDRDVAQRAASLLSESRANVGVVMNKNRSYVPRMLHQEL